MSESVDQSPVIGEKAQRLHDLRQPLAAILAAATAMQQDVLVDSQMRDKLLKIIVDNATRLSEMIDDPGASD